MQLHKLLDRHLQRLKLNEKTPPNEEQWGQFLGRVNSAYSDADQDRYLLERSMNLSSNELLELNARLEKAQQIAGLGYWTYNKKSDQFVISKELYDVLELNSETTPKDYDQFLFLVHDHERDALEELINRAFTTGEGYEMEFRILTSHQNYKWVYCIGTLENDEVEESAILTGITMDIHKRKQTEEEIARLNQKVVDSARMAGMADVATSILHNVGNILNSANVSLSLLQENLKKPYFGKLFLIGDMLKNNQDHLQDYLVHDEKGKLVPKYISATLEHLKTEYAHVLSETDNLASYLEHIKEIVATQQTISKVAKFKEKVCIQDLVDGAIKMVETKLKENDIKLIRNYEDDSFIVTDKSKVMQILVNLVQNAGDAISAVKDQHEKEIKVSIVKSPTQQDILINVEDNGIGILPENLAKIFSFGFTTKPQGHGFGLHNSILTAKELGGSLSAQSEGFQKGTTFNLTLPLHMN